MPHPSSYNAANLLEQTTVGIIAVDLRGVVRTVNTAAERLLGKPRRLLLDAPLAQRLPGHPVALDLIERAKRMGAPCRVRNARLSPSPEISVAVSLTAAPLLDGEGRLAGAMLHMEEVGAAERLEEGARLLETLDSVGALALAVAHEVKNPLAGIRGAAQLLEMEGISPGGLECTQLIRAEVDRISRLLDSLLGLADPHPLDQQSVNIHEVLDHVLQLTRGVSPNPTRDYDPSLPPVRGDGDRLVQLFLNLVKNAQEAAGPEGEVSLHTRISNQVRMENGRRSLHVMVEVRDNGPGVPEELRQRIFIPFVSTKSGGVGLGLAISQKIVNDHNGLLEVESRPGLTQFRVFLPMSSLRP
ncbi:MAG: PAS domain-containing protein [Magnetococcales bacterium]|nr:PAS domain-containing protein [Magnetococcales bacterium]